jgi:polyprenyl-phospho-N-acetylgalactosaminyl synthase
MLIAVVPAYNEEKTISAVVRGLVSRVDHVVVIDDCSLDETSRLAKEAGAIVFRHEINRGQGAAIQTGHNYAISIGADFVVHFDGDDQFDPVDIEPALKFMQEKSTDVLFGSRFLDNRSAVPWSKKKIILPLGRLLNWLLTGIKLTDAHNGFIILNRQALEKINITQDRMAHASELLFLVKKHNLKYAEYPVRVFYHEYGQQARGGIKIIRDLIMGRFVK